MANLRRQKLTLLTLPNDIMLEIFKWASDRRYACMCACEVCAFVIDAGVQIVRTGTNLLENARACVKQ
jgi:hypothetical protein